MIVSIKYTFCAHTVVIKSPPFPLSSIPHIFPLFLVKSLHVNIIFGKTYNFFPGTYPDPLYRTVTNP